MNINKQNHAKMCATKKNKRVIPQSIVDECLEPEKLFTVGCDDKVLWLCEEHGPYSQALRMHVNLRTGERRQGCRKCGFKATNFKRGIEYRKERWKPFLNDLYYETERELAKQGLLAITNNKLWFKCPTHEKYEQIAYNHVCGECGCPFCAEENKGVWISKFEEEIREFVGDCRNNVRDVIQAPSGKAMELDIYIPEKNIAIECNGEYYHQESDMLYDEWIKQDSEWKKHNKFKGYHQWKTDRCAELGIKLIHIWYEDWKKDKQSVLNFIEDQLKEATHE